MALFEFGQEDAKEPVKHSPFVVTLLLASVFLFIPACFVCIGLYELESGIVSLHWPQVNGVVQSAVIDTIDTETSATMARISYNYSVNGRQYTGHRVSYDDYGSNNPSHAEDIVRQYPVGQTVTVFYNPGDPSVCLLHPGIGTSSLLMVVLGSGFVGPGILALIIYRRWFAKKNACAPTGTTIVTC